MLNPNEIRITKDHQYGFQRKGYNFGEFYFVIKQLRFNGKAARYLYALRKPVIQLEGWFRILSSLNLMFIGQCIIVIIEEKIQLHATYYFIVLLIGSICFRHYRL